jgi:hypothetical protein
VASNFPTSLDNFTNPSSGNTLDSPSHSLQHSDINDAVEALEAKLGIGASPAGSATSGQVLTAGTAGTTTWQTPATDNTAWTSFTPTLSGVTLGNGTTNAKYKQIGKTVFGHVAFKLGSTSSITGTIKTTFPVAPATIFTGGVDYTGMFLDDSFGYYLAFPVLESPLISFFACTAGGTYVSYTNTSSTVPFTWTTNDVFYVTFTYEAA